MHSLNVIVIRVKKTSPSLNFIVITIWAIKKPRIICDRNFFIRKVYYIGMDESNISFCSTEQERVSKNSPYSKTKLFYYVKPVQYNTNSKNSTCTKQLSQKPFFGYSNANSLRHTHTKKKPFFGISAQKHCML